MEIRESFDLGIGVFILFMGMIFLKLSETALSNGMFTPVFMGTSLMMLIIGTYKITEIISNLNDTFLFTFFSNMEHIRIFVKNGGTLSLYISSSVIILSLLGYLVSNTLHQSLVGAVFFCLLFPILVLTMRLNKRVKVYRKLSQDVEETGI